MSGFFSGSAKSLTDYCPGAHNHGFLSTVPQSLAAFCPGGFLSDFWCVHIPALLLIRHKNSSPALVYEILQCYIQNTSLKTHFRIREHKNITQIGKNFNCLKTSQKTILKRDCKIIL